MKLTECPICGSKNIKFKKGNYHLTDDNKNIIKTIPNVNYYICISCDEKIVNDSEVNKIITKKSKQLIEMV